MDNKQIDNVLKFDLSPRQIKFKEILNKEFIELEIWAISTIYPNRNKSHFTVDSLIDVIPNVKNKPIVGFFENNDFTTHEGKADFDPEYQKNFWNTEKGERILGWVRESDPVEVVEKDGLHWLKFRCVLCTTYCYRQVKRLLKDRKKKVSVEITVKEHEFVDNIEIIHKFTLNGVTILGSKNGKSVLEGIPGAHLSVLEGLDNDAMEEQRRVLTFAYTQLDGEGGASEDNKVVKDSNLDEENTEKEVKQADMDNLETNANVENVENMETYAAHIKVDKSAEAMSDKPWGEVDKTELRRKVVEADNFKEVAKDIFLDLREGWEDGEVSKLKYPVMELKGNTAVYNREGLASAKAYATQHDEKEVLEKLAKIYEHLGLDESEEETEKACKMCDNFKEDYCDDCGCEGEGDDDKGDDKPEEGKEENYSEGEGEKHPEDCDCPECQAAKSEKESVEVTEVTPDVAVITETGEEVNENKDTLSMEDIDVDLGIPQCQDGPSEAEIHDGETVLVDAEAPSSLMPEEGIKATIANDEGKAEITIIPDDNGEKKEDVAVVCENNCDGDAGDSDSDKDITPEEPAHDYAKEAEDLKVRCNTLEEELSAANQKVAECEAKLEACADYEEIKTKLASAEAKLYAIHLAELKQCAIELMCNETIKSEFSEEIIAKCESGKYSCEDDIKKDIAIAIYSSRPAQEKRFSVSIPMTETVEVKSEKPKHVSSADKIKAYIGK